MASVILALYIVRFIAIRCVPQVNQRASVHLTVDTDSVDMSDTAIQTSGPCRTRGPSASVAWRSVRRSERRPGRSHRRAVSYGFRTVRAVIRVLESARVFQPLLRLTHRDSAICLVRSVTGHGWGAHSSRTPIYHDPSRPERWNTCWYRSTSRRPPRGGFERAAERYPDATLRPVTSDPRHPGLLPRATGRPRRPGASR